MNIRLTEPMFLFYNDFVMRNAKFKLQHLIDFSAHFLSKSSYKSYMTRENHRYPITTVLSCHDTQLHRDTCKSLPYRQIFTFYLRNKIYSFYNA